MDRFTRILEAGTVRAPKGVLCGFRGIHNVGVVAMKKLVVVVVGLLGAILAGGAGWNF